jgi:hypothetical protein
MTRGTVKHLVSPHDTRVDPRRTALRVGYEFVRMCFGPFECESSAFRGALPRTHCRFFGSYTRAGPCASRFPSVLAGAQRPASVVLFESTIERARFWCPCRCAAHRGSHLQQAALASDVAGPFAPAVESRGNKRPLGTRQAGFKRAIISRKLRTGGFMPHLPAEICPLLKKQDSRIALSTDRLSVKGLRTLALVG